MKITKTQLKQIIKEELTQVIDDQDLNEIFSAARNLARAVVPGGLEGGDQAWIDKVSKAISGLTMGRSSELADKIIVGHYDRDSGQRSPKAEQLGLFLVTDMTPEEKAKVFKGLSKAQVKLLVMAMEWEGPEGMSGGTGDPVNRVLKHMGKNSVNILVSAVEKLVSNLDSFHDHPDVKYKPSIENLHPNIRKAYGAGDKFAPNS